MLRLHYDQTLVQAVQWALQLGMLVRELVAQRAECW